MSDNIIPKTENSEPENTAENQAFTEPETMGEETTLLKSSENAAPEESEKTEAEESEQPGAFLKAEEEPGNAAVETIRPTQSYYQYNPGTGNTYTEPEAPAGKGLAIAGMVCGIVSLVMVCCFWPIGIVCALVGLVLSIIALVKKQNKGMSIAGIITSGLGVLFTILMLIFSAVVMQGIYEAVDDPVFQERLERELESQDLEQELEILEEMFDK